MTWETKPTELDWSRLVDAIGDAESILCISHVNPDGDTIGSAIGVALALKKLGKHVSVSFAEPFVVPQTLEWMPGLDLLIEPELAPTDCDLAISFDASSIDRLGTLGANAQSCALFAALDHHRSYTGFAQLSLVDSDAPATGVLALELIDQLEIDIDQDIASCIYTAIVTDTGSFKFAGTTAAIHRMAARLHETGIRHDEIARAVFDDRSYASLQLLGVALAKAQLDRDAFGGLGFIGTQISRADREVLGLPLDAAESVIDTIRTVSEAEVAAVAKQGDDGIWRMSTRSKGKVDVGAVCTELGGGGHRLAAGYSSDGDGDFAIQSFKAQIERAR